MKDGFRLQRKKAYHVPHSKGHSTPTSTNKSIQNDVCTSTIIVVFAFHGAFSFLKIQSILLRIHLVLYTFSPFCQEKKANKQKTGVILVINSQKLLTVCEKIDIIYRKY